LKTADIGAELSETGFDRAILDLPEPWQALDKLGEALRPGGILLCYLPTILQVKALVDALHESRSFACVETMETLLRFWHIKGASVRPQHRMVAHTGFLTAARRLAPDAAPIARP